MLEPTQEVVPSRSLDASILSFSTLISLPIPENLFEIEFLIHSFRDEALSASMRCRDVVGKLLGLRLVLPLITRKLLPELLNCCELQILLLEVEMTILDPCHRVVITASSNQGSRRTLQTEFL